MNVGNASPDVFSCGWHDTEIRVRYAETDQMGLAYNGHYLAWFEVGRTELLRAIGQNYRTTEAQGYFLPLSAADIRYLKPARYDDVLTIRSWICEKPGVRLKIGYEIIRGSDVIATGHTEHAFTNNNLAPVRPPQELRELLTRLWMLAESAERNDT